MKLTTTTQGSADRLMQRPGANLAEDERAILGRAGWAPVDNEAGRVMVEPTGLTPAALRDGLYLRRRTNS